jgi:hypothetical protein
MIIALFGLVIVGAVVGTYFFFRNNKNKKQKVDKFWDDLIYKYDDDGAEKLRNQTSGYSGHSGYSGKSGYSGVSGR